MGEVVLKCFWDMVCYLEVLGPLFLFYGLGRLFNILEDKF